MAVELGSHQLIAVEELDNGKVLRGGVGSGKSRVALHYFFTKECGGEVRVNGRGNYRPMVDPKDLYIITTARKRDGGDWLDEGVAWGLGTDRDVSAGHVKVTVDSWNNIENYVGVKDAFFVFDEQRLVGAGAWVKAFLKIAKSNRWILLSATPGDNWMDYIPVFLANGWYKNRSEFVHTHVVYRPFSKYPQIERFTEIKQLSRYRDLVLVDMPYERTTIRHTYNYIVAYDKEKFDEITVKRWHIYEERPIKDVAEMFRVMRKLVNSDLDRASALMQLMEKHPKLIVFYNFDYELDILRVLGLSTLTHYAEWNGHKHQDIPEFDKWLYFVQYTAGSEAWNCTTTDSSVFWSLNYSYKIMEQCKGRTDRMNTPYIDLNYYLFRSKSAIDNAIAKALVNKKNFNEKELSFA